MEESAAMGVSGMAAPATSMPDRPISSPPSFTRSSCLSVPVAVRKVPAASPEMVSAAASSSPWRL